MKYYLADYRIYVGDHEYLERGVLSSRSYKTAKKRAVKDRKFLPVMDGRNFANLRAFMKYPNSILRS
jgi:hypothetical protein